MLTYLNNSNKVKDIRDRFRSLYDSSNSFDKVKILHHKYWDESLSYIQNEDVLTRGLISHFLKELYNWEEEIDGSFKYNFEKEYRIRTYEFGRFISNGLFWASTYNNSLEYINNAREHLGSDELTPETNTFIHHSEEVGLVVYVARMMWEKDLCELMFHILDDILPNKIEKPTECECL